MLDKKKSYLWAGLLIVFILFIFGNSLTLATISSANSGTVLQWVKNIVSVFGLNTDWITNHIIRKLAHFLEYFVLGMLLYKNLRLYFNHVRNNWLLGLWLGLMIPLIDETLQLVTEGRSGQISDIWLDYTGVISGIIMLQLIKYIKYLART